MPKDRCPVHITTDHSFWYNYRRITRFLNAATAKLDNFSIAVSSDVLRSILGWVRRKTVVQIQGIELTLLWELRAKAVDVKRIDADTLTRMKWYFESSHYTTDLGDLIQDRVFDYKDLSRTVPDYFGVLITSQNIEEHLANIREQNQRFRELQPSVAKELSDAASKFDISDEYARDITGANITYKW